MRYIILFFLFFFLACSNTQDNVCHGVNCGKGSCAILDDAPYCDCLPGYEARGLSCVSKSCEPECKEGESCELEGNYLYCKCSLPGYHLEDGVCTKNDTGCSPECGQNEYCSKIGAQHICICKNDYIRKGNKCIFVCKENSHPNSENNSCICDDGYYKEGGECLLKLGCKRDDVNCGQGQCKEDIEKDYYCDCDDGYYFDGITCKQIKCYNQILCDEKCCNNNQICSLGKCINKKVCNNNNNCSDDEFCDYLNNVCNKIDNTNICYHKPDIQEELTPSLKWHWPKNPNLQDFKHVIMAPVVANMTDDNGDNKVDLKDTPDVIFLAFGGAESITAHLFIIDGESGDTIAEFKDYLLDGGSSLVVGDIDNDNQNEIIAISKNRKNLIAFEYDLNSSKIKEKWKQNTELKFNKYNNKSGAPVLADIDHDGTVEVVAGNYIINAKTGKEICHSTDSLKSFGKNYNNRYVSIVEDVNNDGFMDIITGNQFISGKDCSRIIARDDRKDGYPSIADLDNDGTPEVVVISEGYLYVYDIETMEDKIKRLKVDIEVNNRKPIGGPPTIANFDDDDDLEIAIAGTTQYRVIDVDLNLGVTTEQSYLWREDTKDETSRMTGSSLFDFEGDGQAEVLYADECYFRVYDGKTGREKFKLENSSETVLEYPLVVDVDNDGKSEIVLVSNNNRYVSQEWDEKCNWPVGTYGVRVFEDENNNWVRTRRIWNQHSYHITNVNEDGTIPKNEKHNWLEYNNYRLNSQGKGIFNAPDFLIERIDVERIDCPKLKFKFKITVLNTGTLNVAKGISLSIYRGKEATPLEKIATIKTKELMQVGKRINLNYEYMPNKNNLDSILNLFFRIDDKGNSKGDYTECNEDNNVKEISLKGNYDSYCKSGEGVCVNFLSYECNEENKLVCKNNNQVSDSEVCGDGLDNNCDGKIDENCSCNSGESQECYSASESFVKFGVCKKGIMNCIGGEFWGECKDEVLPSLEKCNGLDDDCDNSVDEDFQIGQKCDVGEGECKNSGIYICDSNGNQICNAKAKEPKLEICDNGLDDDCDGYVDEKPCQL